MLQVAMTPRLLGFKVTGDYDALDKLYDAVWALTLDDEFHPTGDRPKGSVDESFMCDRLLALAYDLRKAMQGSRTVEFVDSGLDIETAKWHGVPHVETTAVFSVNIVYPEAIYQLLAISYLIQKRRVFLRGYGELKPYGPDKSLLDSAICAARHYQSLLLSAVEQAVSPSCFDLIRKLCTECHSSLPGLYSQWLDVLDCEWAHMSCEQRLESMSAIVQSIAEYFKQDRYRKLQAGINKCVREWGGRRTDYEIDDKWPGQLEW